MQNAAPHKASLASCETALWFQANASCSSPYLDYRQVTSSIDHQTFKLLPSVRKVKFLQTQIRLNTAGIQRGPSHAKHFRWGTTQREIRWEHRSYPLLDILVLFGFCGSMVSSGDLPVLRGCNISPPAAAYLWSSVTFLSADSTGGKQRFLPRSVFTTYCTWFSLLWSFARHFTDPHEMRPRLWVREWKH